MTVISCGTKNTLNTCLLIQSEGSWLLHLFCHYRADGNILPVRLVMFHSIHTHLGKANDTFSSPVAHTVPSSALKADQLGRCFQLGTSLLSQHLLTKAVVSFLFLVDNQKNQQDPGASLTHLYGDTLHLGLETVFSNSLLQ